MEVKRVENLDEVFECGRHLEIAILRKSRTELLNCTGRMVKYLEGLREAEETYKVVYRNMYNLLSRELNARGEKKEYIYTIADKKKMDYAMMEQAFASLAAQLSQLWDKEEPKEGEDMDIQDVFRYMEENFGDYSLSLQSAAEKFGMTYSNMSHYFKNSTGVNFPHGWNAFGWKRRRNCWSIRRNRWRKQRLRWGIPRPTDLEGFSKSIAG